MDSFYDAPRRAPVPTPIGRLLPTAVVPEVSILCNNNKVPPNNYTAYNAWKNSETNFFVANKENVAGNQQNTSACFKKQVRFESPVLQQPCAQLSDSIAKNNVQYRPSLPSYPQVAACGPRPNLSEVRFSNITQTRPAPVSNFHGKTFEQVYLANVPNRHLDLSTIDVTTSPKVPECKVTDVQSTNFRPYTNTLDSFENGQKQSVEKPKETPPKSYKEFMSVQTAVAKRRDQFKAHNDSVTDILNYRSPKNSPKSCEPCRTSSDLYVFPNGRSAVQEHRKTDDFQPVFSKGMQSSQKKNVDDGTQTSRFFQVSKELPTDAEPTVKDLLKIISQQNEQLLLLQKQVATLINRDQQQQQKQIEAPPPAPQPAEPAGHNNYVTSTQHENYRNNNADSPRKRALSKFSIDLMTSFEVSFRPQQPKHKDYVNYGPKIQEITENIESSDCRSDAAVEIGTVDTSMHFQEPLRVVENCPSPEPSIKITMNDYDSSDEDDDAEGSGTEIGASFYKNLMGQVNNILQKAQVQTNDELQAALAGCGTTAGDGVRDRTMQRVKEATLKHLKSIGVNPVLDDSGPATVAQDSAEDCSASEISFVVKQLLMKYLPAEHLAKVKCKTGEPVGGGDEPTDKRVGLIATRPEFSFASVQYMKKYNLMAATSNDGFARGPKVMHRATQNVVDNPKILDISKLKNQPKLL